MKAHSSSPARTVSATVALLALLVSNIACPFGYAETRYVSTSPCIHAGINQSWMFSAVDIDGESRIGNGTVDMGCDEVYAEGLTGVLSVALFADYTNVSVGLQISFEADIQGRPAAYYWRGRHKSPRSSHLSAHRCSSAGDKSENPEAIRLGNSYLGAEDSCG